MLSKTDLGQIKDIVTGVVHEELEPVKKDIKSMQNDMEIVQKDIKILKKNDTKIRKDLKTAIDYFDRGDVVLQTKVERIEKHLGLVNN